MSTQSNVNACAASGATCDVQVTLYLADSLVRSGQWALAVDHYRWAGAAFLARGEVHNALAVYALLGRLLPHCLHTQGMIAQSYRQLGRLAEAAGIYDNVARAHYSHGRWVEAAQVFQMVVDIDPATVPRRLHLAELYVRLGHVGTAIHHLEVATGQLAAGGRLKEYVRAARRLLSLQPENVPTLRELVRVYLRYQDVRRATKYLRRLLSIRPTDDVGRELLASCLSALGRRDLASIALCRLADLVRRRGVHALDKAKRLLERAVALTPYDRAAQTDLRALEAEMAEVARRDFADARATGVIEPVSTDELLASPQPDDASTNVRQLRAAGVPVKTTDPHSNPEGQVIYAQFA